MAATIKGDGTMKWGSAGAYSLGVVVNANSDKQAKTDDTATDAEGATAAVAFFDENHSAKAELYFKTGTTPPALGSNATVTCGGVAVPAYVTSVGGTVSANGWQRMSVGLTAWMNVHP
jgi:hypothetical protein